MFIYQSRYTPNLANGEYVDFQKGEKVHFRMRNGTELDIIIDSERMQHSSGYIGYEAIYTDNYERSFAPAIGIVDWEGKC